MLVSLIFIHYGAVFTAGIMVLSRRSRVVTLEVLVATASSPNTGVFLNLFEFL